MFIHALIICLIIGTNGENKENEHFLVTAIVELNFSFYLILINLHLNNHIWLVPNLVSTASKICRKQLAQILYYKKKKNSVTIPPKHTLWNR